MKTKEFIKMLKEADPSGEAHVRMCGGAPYWAELKEGYWDGSYCYIDKDGKYVTSIEGMKVDIHCKEPDDYLYYMKWNSYKESTKGLFNKLKKNFVFKLGGYAIPKQRQEKKDEFFKDLKETFNQHINLQRSMDKECLVEIVEKYKKGWRFHQKENSEQFGKYKNNFYDWKILDEEENKQGANLGTTKPILLSGKFKSTKSKFSGYLEWILI